MSGSFSDAMTILLREEGGYSNHSRDPGGMTNLGVTARAWAAWTSKVRPSEAEMRGLTHAKVAPFYRAMYWDKARCDDLPPALALAVFDFAVNSGPARAARTLQRVIGAKADGLIGRMTLARLQERVRVLGLATLVERYMDERRDFLRGLDTFDVFGKGWLARCKRIEVAALDLIP